MKTLIDEVIGLKYITHLWLTAVCVWPWQCLGMYINNHCLAMFYVSFNVTLRALSFETTIVPQPSGLSVLIRALSNYL